MKIDYKAVLAQALQELDSMLKYRQELDLRIVQKEQFIRAAATQLPDRAREQFEGEFDDLIAGQSGLSTSIRIVLRATPRKWLTATEVRDALVKSGFNFANYVSNPLASVHSSLKRLRSEDAEMATREGVMAWRWKSATANPRGGRRRRISLVQAMARSTSIALANVRRNLLDSGSLKMEVK